MVTQASSTLLNALTLNLKHEIEILFPPILGS